MPASSYTPHRPQPIPFFSEAKASDLASLALGGGASGVAVLGDVCARAARQHLRLGLARILEASPC